MKDAADALASPRCIGCHVRDRGQTTEFCFECLEGEYRKLREFLVGCPTEEIRRLVREHREMREVLNGIVEASAELDAALTAARGVLGRLWV